MGLGNWGGRKIIPRDIPALVAAAQELAQQHAPRPGHTMNFQPNAQGQVDNTPPGASHRGLELHNAAQPTGSLADLTAGGGLRGSSAVRLGRGMHAGGLGRGFENFDRYAVNRGGKTLEAHDYGDGNIKYFARKNPAILQAAVQQKLGGGQPGAPAMPAGLAPQDLELIKRLLGGGTLTR